MSPIPNVVVKRRQPKGICLSLKRLKNGELVARDHPRDGYFYVAWVRKPKKLPSDVTNSLRSKTIAVRIAELLNSMTRRQAIFLVTQLYRKGGDDRSGEILKKHNRLTVRSFEWPR